MKLEGIHHITAITGDAQGNVDFYAGVLGLRLVKKTVNQDDPSVYHLFYADEQGSPGADITFFEFRGAPQGRAGAGMVHTVGWRVASNEALDFWAGRLEASGVESRRGPATLDFADPEGLAHQLRVVATDDAPLIADHPEIPRELALQGFDGVRAYSLAPSATEQLLERLGFEPLGDGWETRGAIRGGLYANDEPSDERRLAGAGTVHHVAFSSTPADHEAWRALAIEAGARPTDVIDRFYFRSVYFREPGGVLFEIATMGPGFAVDEPAESMGESLSLPPAFEPLRERLDSALTPLRNPRQVGA